MCPSSAHACGGCRDESLQPLGAFLPWWGQRKEGARDTGPDHQQRHPGTEPTVLGEGFYQFCEEQEPPLT